MIEPIEPIIKYSLNKIEFGEYNKIGSELIKNNKLAVCTLAGRTRYKIGA